MTRASDAVVKAEIRSSPTRLPTSCGARAATRVYTQPAAPGALDPKRIAPGVLFLASEVCNVTGVVLGAADGWFGVRSWARSEGVDLGYDVTPEAVAERWNDIASA